LSLAGDVIRIIARLFPFALERNIKLPPSMMTQSWMGTDFTNDDLVKKSSIVEDYDHTIIGDTVIRNRSCYAIRMIPKPTAAVVWSKVIICIDQKCYPKGNAFDGENFYGRLYGYARSLDLGK
jgi:hypothetical protein